MGQASMRKWKHRVAVMQRSCFCGEPLIRVLNASAWACPEHGEQASGMKYLQDQQPAEIYRVALRARRLHRQGRRLSRYWSQTTNVDVPAKPVTFGAVKAAMDELWNRAMRGV